MAEYDQSSVRYDDLQKIKGIGEVTAQTLNSLGIHTFQDLAQLNSTRLKELLRGKVSELTLRRIETDDWPGQARNIINLMGETSDGKQDKLIQRETWRELADFFISFGYRIDAKGEEHLETKAHHSQADKLNQWDGIVSDQLIAWMLDQANISYRAIEEVSAPEPELASSLSGPSDESNALRLVFSDVSVNEISAQTDLAEKGSKNYLRVETHLTLLDDETLSQMSDRTPFTVEVYLIDMETNQPHLVSVYSDELTQSKMSYPICQEIDIPESGRYQLFLFARLMPPLIGIAQVQGPLIRVEA